MCELKNIVKKDYIENDKSLCFETIPLSKVFVLSILSFGFYDIIIAFNWWKSLKDNFGYKVSPFWRGIFNIFTNIRFFSIFEKYFKLFNPSEKSFSGIFLAIIYLVLNLWSESLSFKEIMMDIKGTLTVEREFFWEFVCFVFLFFTTRIIISIQNKINNTNNLYFPNAKVNNWNKTNIIWTIILSIIFLFNIVCIFI